MAGTGFGLTAQTVSEGILITFNNIPQDSVRLFIDVASIGDSETYSGGVMGSFADIRDASNSGGPFASVQLERIKETGKVIFPFAQAGQKLRITAQVTTRSDLDNHVTPGFIVTRTVAEKNGTGFNREDLRFELNETHTAVTLHSMPVFSSDVVLHSRKIDFTVLVLANGVDNLISTGVHHIPAGLSPDGLTWTFEPEMSADLRNHDALQSGNFYTAWAMAAVNVIHDGILWSVDIARTPNFNWLCPTKTQHFQVLGSVA
jgi:hypothetical protein